MSFRAVVVGLLLVSWVGACGGDESSSKPDPTGETNPFADYTLDPEIYSTPPSSWESDTPAQGSPYSLATDQVLLLLEQGQTHEAAQAVATALGASIVGQIPAIGFYQLQLAQTGRAAVDAAIAQAEADAAVAAAFYNLRAQTFATACPAECDLSGRAASPDQCPYRESEYFETLTVIDNLRAGLGLTKVRVGIVDTGIRKVPELAPYALLNADNPGTPIPKVEVDDNGTTRADDSHGTAVASIIAARDGNGGVNGLASRMLANKLELVWGGSSGPSEHAAIDAAGDGAGWMVSTIRVAQAGAQVVNMSYGWERGSPNLDKMVATFTRIFLMFPETVFVIAAPSNQAYALDGSNAAPAGISLPNVITVGGTALCTPASAFGASTTGSRIDVAAPAFAWAVNVQGGDPVTLKQGNSYAAPQVTALVAVLRAIAPTLPAAMIKTTYVVGQTYPTAAAVSGRRLAFSLAILQLLVDQGRRLDLVDPNGHGTADPVGVVINRICGGLDYKIVSYGSHHVGTENDEIMGFIYDGSFGFFATPEGKPYLEMGCGECPLDLKEYPVGDDLAPGEVAFSWQQGEGSDVAGAAVSGTLSLDSCRIDEREQIYGGPFIVSLRAHFDGTMMVGPFGDVGAANFDGAFNIPFAVGVLTPADVIEDIEVLCEGGELHP